MLNRQQPHGAVCEPDPEHERIQVYEKKKKLSQRRKSDVSVRAYIG
jgi:hypothetical protein